MEIGDLVLFRGELYYLRGLDPMSVSERRAQLEHAVSGDLIQAPLAEVEPAPPNGISRCA
jgi:hypothetical protein